MLWDLYGRVIDNLGDVGVCWRLAADLASRGEQVRLWLDDASALSFMAPEGTPGVELRPWPDARTPVPTPGDVVVEAFGIELPYATRQALRAARRPPVWLNLEHLSAEPYVERSHALPSPQPDGLRKWFFYPGFTPRTGGLLRQPGLAARRAAFDRAAWLHAQGVAPLAHERTVLMFCYAPHAAMPALLAELGREPTLLLATAGAVARQLHALPRPPRLRVHALPWLSQADFDHALWCAELLFVRGEDSLVRAIWAGAPFVWQAYVQDDGAHHAKIEAMLATLAAPADWQAWWRRWNAPAGTAGLPPLPGPWPGLAAARERLLASPDLVTQLLEFVQTRRRDTAAG